MSALYAEEYLIRQVFIIISKLRKFKIKKHICTITLLALALALMSPKSFSDKLFDDADVIIEENIEINLHALKLLAEYKTLLSDINSYSPELLSKNNELFSLCETYGSSIKKETCDDIKKIVTRERIKW